MRRRSGARILLGCVALGVLVPSCLFVPGNNPVDAYRSARRLAEFDEVDPRIPHITIVLHAFREDAIDVYSPGSEEEQIFIAEAAAASFGESFPVAEPNFFEDNRADVQLGHRLLKREGDLYTLTVPTQGLQAAVESREYSGFDLLICPPNAEAVFLASRPPDFEACINGRAWEVGDERLTVTVTVRPRTAHYLIFVASVILGLVLLGALAWFVGSRLREGPFRNRTSSAVALGLIVGVLAGGGVAWSIASAAMQLGPSDNIALSKDLGVGLYALSAALPALAGAIPGLIFLILLVKRRPWPDQLRPELPAFPPPPPPGGPGSSPPPPLPFGGR